jgi:hypothetical protein
MLEKLVRSTRSVVGGILLLVFVIVFIFASEGVLRGNGEISRPEPFGDGDDIAILNQSWGGLSRDLNLPGL